MKFSDIISEYSIKPHEQKELKDLLYSRLNIKISKNKTEVSASNVVRIRKYLDNQYHKDVKKQGKSDKAGHSVRKPCNTGKKYNTDNVPHDLKNINHKLINLGSYQNTKKILNECVREKYMVIIDTCTFMETPVEKLMDNILDDIFLRTNRKYVIPYIVKAELEYHSTHNSDERKRKRTKFCVNMINKKEEAGLADVPFKESDWPDRRVKPFADKPIYQRIHDALYQGKNVLVITRDSKLKRSLINLTNIPAIRVTGKIIVKSVSPNGHLCEVEELIMWDNERKAVKKNTVDEKIPKQKEKENPEVATSIELDRLIKSYGLTYNQGIEILSRNGYEVFDPALIIFGEKLNKFRELLSSECSKKKPEKIR
ncbi:MAG: hypothetical protein K2J36_06410 [Ruminococcus sp.]|nr:hypothetical protein [Ruminococcus sp.]MDE6797626.1 hypothetical protein [Ruminococcus sp.]